MNKYPTFYPGCREFYTVNEIADFFQISRRTVYRYIKTRKIKAIKVGQWRIKSRDFDEFLDKRMR